jgi:hypothetical protein
MTDPAMSEIEDAVRALLHDPDLDDVTPGAHLLAAVRDRRSRQLDRRRHAVWGALASAAAVVVAAVIVFARPDGDERVRPAAPPSRTVSVPVTSPPSAPASMPPTTAPGGGSPTVPTGTRAPSGSPTP